MKVNAKIQYAFRRPRFPIICAVGAELISAESAAGFQRQIERFEFDVATGEGWAFHADLTIVSPLTLKKRWTKAAVIRLFNESQNARRIGGVYPKTALSNKPLIRIIAEVAALAAHASPHRPRHTNTLKIPTGD